MGLSDRDYMHERHRKPRGNSTPRSQPYRTPPDTWPMIRIAWWTICVCSLVYLGTKYLILPVGTMPFPGAGHALWFAAHDSATAPLTVIAPIRGDSLYAVRVQEFGTGRLIVIIPVRKGETVKVQVPLGQYEMVFASGSRWYGPEKLFGFLGEKKKAVKTFDFYRSGNQTTGHTVDLTNRINGNLPTRVMTPLDK